MFLWLLRVQPRLLHLTWLTVTHQTLAFAVCMDTAWDTLINAHHNMRRMPYHRPFSATESK